MIERRKQDRNQMRIPVRLRAKGVVRWGETVIKDLSGGGFRCIAHGTFWLVGTVVTFEMPLFLAEPAMSGSVRVIHVEQLPHSNVFDVGMAFLEVSKEARRQLERFLTEQR